MVARITWPKIIVKYIGWFYWFYINSIIISKKFGSGPTVSIFLENEQIIVDGKRKKNTYGFSLLHICTYKKNMVVVLLFKNI